MKKHSTWETVAWHVLVQHTGFFATRLSHIAIPYWVGSGSSDSQRSEDPMTGGRSSNPWGTVRKLSRRWDLYSLSKKGISLYQYQWRRCSKAGELPALTPPCHPTTRGSLFRALQSLAKVFLPLLLKQLSKEPPCQFQAFPRLQPSNSNPSALSPKSCLSADLCHPK